METWFSLPIVQQGSWNEAAQMTKVETESRGFGGFVQKRRVRSGILAETPTKTPLNKKSILLH